MTEERKADISLSVDIFTDTHDVEYFANIEVSEGQMIGLLDMVATILHEATDADPVVLEDMEDLENFILNAPREKIKLKRVK